MLEEDFGFIVALLREEIRAIRADELLVCKLDVEIDDPLLFRQRLVFDTDGQVIESNKVYYKGDGFNYTIDIERR